MAQNEVRASIGIVGTGFVSHHFVMALDRHQGLTASRVLTRRRPDTCNGFAAQDRLTNSVDELLDACDIVFECTGDAVYAAEVVDRALDAGRPVVTLNPEFHVTVGSYFVGKGLVTEAEGDQPGCQAALKEEAEELGFEPLVYGNMKGFLNRDPTPEEMDYWGKRQGLSLAMVTSFTDGTKLQVEQALVANGLGGTIAQPELVGPETDDLASAASLLADRAKAVGQPISDYVLSAKLPHGVFVVAEHDPRQRDCLRYLKLGDGPYYVVQKSNIFVHLEAVKTIKRVLTRKDVLLNNSETPRVSVATVAKRDLSPGDRIEHGIGSFDVRGIAVRIVDNAGHVPIGLVNDAVVKQSVSRGQVITFDDLDVPDNLALKAWLQTESKVLGQAQESPRVAV